MDVTAFASALFDGCTLLLVSVLFLVHYLHHVSENLSGKIFFGMCICLSLIAVFELSDALIRIDGVRSETEIVLSMVLCSLYFLGMGVLLLELVLFLFSLLKEENFFRHPLFWILVSLPALGILVLLICNPIFDSFFFDIRLGEVGESTYIRGQYFPFFYILTLIYVLVIASLVFLCYRLLPKRKAITFLGMMFLVAGAVSFQYFFPQIHAVFSAHIEEVEVQDAMDNVHQRDFVIQFQIFRPERGISVLDWVVVFFLTTFRPTLPFAPLDGRVIVDLVDLIEVGAGEAPNLIIRYSSVELGVVGQDEQLLYIVAPDRLSPVIRVVVADLDHFPDKGADNEQGVAVE